MVMTVNLESEIETAKTAKMLDQIDSGICFAFAYFAHFAV